MEKILTNYQEILKQIDSCKKNCDHGYTSTELIAVSKKFPKEKIQILLNAGHKVFGENKVQEAKSKWIDIRKENKGKYIELHLIGPLQSNKVFQALDVFDVIQTLDREKIAKKAQKYFEDKPFKSNKRFFVQVNIGEESQKSVIEPNLVNQFVKWCSCDLKLNIIGLMCIPPIDKHPNFFFKKIRCLCDELKLEHASMGMSNDYISAIQNGATFIRVGTGIFGARD